MAGLGATRSPLAPDPMAEAAGPRPADPVDNMTQGSPGPAPMQGDQPNAPPEMQKAYEDFVGRAMMTLWSPRVSKGLHDRVRTSKDPVSTVAEVASQVGLKVIREKAQEGQPVPPPVAISGGQEIVSQAAEIAERAGVKLDPDQVESAYYLAVDRARAAAQQEGLLDMESVEQDNQQLSQMKQDGRLDQAWDIIRRGRAQARAGGGGAPKLPTPSDKGLGARKSEAA